MVKKREGYKIVILEPAKTRLKNDECPSCGLPKKEYKRRKDWRCCSVKCTEKFTKLYIYYGWNQLREKVIERDNYTCVKCGKRPEKKNHHNNMKDYINHIKGRWDFIRLEGEYVILIDNSNLIGDHIIPIALGGDEWDIKNIQTLCDKCNKIKTKQDHKDIAKLRRTEKILVGGQTTISTRKDKHENS